MEQQTNPLKYPFNGCDDPRKNYSDLLKNMMATHYLSLSQDEIRKNIILKCHVVSQIDEKINNLNKVVKTKFTTQELLKLRTEKKEIETDVMIDKAEIGYLYNSIDDYNKEYRNMFKLTMGREFVSDLSVARMNYRKMKRDEIEGFNGGSVTKKTKLG